MIKSGHYLYSNLITAFYYKHDLWDESFNKFFDSSYDDIDSLTLCKIQSSSKGSTIFKCLKKEAKGKGRAETTSSTPTQDMMSQNSHTILDAKIESLKAEFLAFKAEARQQFKNTFTQLQTLQTQISMNQRGYTIEFLAIPTEVHAASGNFEGMATNLNWDDTEMFDNFEVLEVGITAEFAEDNVESSESPSH